MSVVTPEPTTNGRAPSSMCRANEHDRCKHLQANCGCSCHGPDGQHAPAPVKWEDPPRRGSRAHQNLAPFETDTAWLRTLKENPGRWARWEPDFPRSKATFWASKINSKPPTTRKNREGRQQILGPGWQARAITFPEGDNPRARSRLYIRYVGEQ